MEQPNYNDLIQLEIPKELDKAILAGIQKGKKNMNRHKYLLRTTAGVAAAFALFVGGINFSPAFAASLEDVAILGTLVKAFQWNTPQVDGGQPTQGEQASIALHKNGEEEQLVLSFNREDAALYHAELKHFPETVTFSLPGTQKVDVVGEVERAKDASAYIKSIYSLDQDNGTATYLQIEFEDTADVSIQEYKDPGSIVIQLKPGVFDGKEIYSVRTLSVQQEGLAEMQKQPNAAQYRILRDEQYGYFLELGQFDTKEEAEQQVKKSTTVDLRWIIEKRWSNNVPAFYGSDADYAAAQMEQEYYEVLMSATDIQPILDYLDVHLATAAPEVQSTLLRGLTGFIRGESEQYDLKALNRYYQMAGQDIFEQLE